MVDSNGVTVHRAITNIRNLLAIGKVPATQPKTGPDTLLRADRDPV